MAATADFESKSTIWRVLEVFLFFATISSSEAMSCNVTATFSFWWYNKTHLFKKQLKIPRSGRLQLLRFIFVTRGAL